MISLKESCPVCLCVSSSSDSQRLERQAERECEVKDGVLLAFNEDEGMSCERTAAAAVVARRERERKEGKG